MEQVEGKGGGSRFRFILDQTVSDPADGIKLTDGWYTTH